MTFILSKKSKPKLVDNTILNQITKQNVLKKQMINDNSEKSKYQLLLTTIHDKCIDYLTNYFWIILIIIVIIYILWCRYKWYQDSLKINNDNLSNNQYKYNDIYFDNDYTSQYNHNDVYQQNKYNLNNQYTNKNQHKYNLNNQYNDNLSNNQHKYNLSNNQHKYNLNNKNKYNLTNNQNKYNLNNNNQNDEINKFDKQNDEINDEINKFDYQNINTQYTNKKDIKYNTKNNNIKDINFDTINDTFYDPIDKNNSNYSFI